jgi:molecular chaperone GrpE
MPVEQEGEERNDPREGTDREQPREEGVRFNDRRRVRVDYPDDEGARAGVEAEDAPSLKPKYVEDLEARTHAAEQKAADVQARFEQVRSQLQRETDEVRRRLNRNADERITREKASFIASLLPVVDNLRRAIEAAEAGGEVSALLDGLRGTVNGFESALAGAGVESDVAVGEQFDPERHEAVDTVEVEPEQDGLVTAEYSRGYRIGNQLLRPARVQVGRARGEAQAAG